MPFSTDVDARKMLPGRCMSGRLRVGESSADGARAWGISGDDDGDVQGDESVSARSCTETKYESSSEGEGGVPEGWTVQDLGYGKDGAVPDGWTTPDLFEAASE